MTTLLENNKTISELIESKQAFSAKGEIIALNSNIRAEYAEALYQMVLENNPVLALEVGMAFGISSLAILTALEKNGEKGNLISIDPFQSTQWKGCGVTAVKRAGFEKRHQLIEKSDFFALPDLLASSQKLDFAYIDGWHTFDYTLIDFWYIDKMMNAGGIVAFNDCHLTAVTKVINFVLSHRKYEEIGAGLPIAYNDYNPLREPSRILSGQPREKFYKQAQDRYFRKLENWEPAWDFYAEF